MFKNYMEDVVRDTSGKFWGIYRGVVEDRNDPLKMHRVRVRIFGLHTPKLEKSGADGIPVDELPWAHPICGVAEGGQSGFGSWTVPLKGTHVMLFFEDGNILQPRYFGVCPNAPRDPKYASNVKEAANSAYQQSRQKFKDGANKAYHNKIDPTKVPPGLGGISQQFESGSRGPYAKNPEALGKSSGDTTGGPSYGSYQFCNEALTKFVGTLPEPHRSNLQSQKKGSSGFNDAWDNAVNDIGAEKFKQLEHAQIQKTHYNPLMASTDPALKLQDRCPGIQDMVWSISVQHGPGASVIRNAGLTPDMTDQQIIEAVYKERSKVEIYFSKLKPPRREQERVRFMNEQKLALDKCKGTNNQLTDATKEQLEKDTQPSEEEFKKDYEATSQPTDGTETDGFKDPDGKYPRRDRDDEPDSHRASRGNTDETADQHVNEHRDGVIEPIKTAGGTKWEEPKTATKTKYPDNNVFATHGGHLIEIDNTDNGKRFRLFHPSNTFMEIDNDGNMVFKNTGNKFDIVLGNRFMDVHKEENKTIKGSCWRLVQENDTEEVELSQKIKIGVDYTREVGMHDKGTVGGNYEREIVGTSRIHSQNTSQLSSDIQVGVYAGGDMGGGSAMTIWSNEGTINETAAQMIRLSAPRILLN